MFVRLAIAADPRRFGRAIENEEATKVRKASNLGEDVRLFALTFLCGFIFVSVFLS
jgi:hypothetical protein